VKKRDEPPPAPREPLPEDCCGKGCTPCVFDTYAEALEKYRAALARRQITGARRRRSLKAK
jgi:hypothetical protein